VNANRHSLVYSEEHLYTKDVGVAAGTASGQALSSADVDQAQSASSVYTYGNAEAQEYAGAVASH
jgi:hypothetical protein